MTKLLSKAQELFMRYGIRSIAMDDLARELGMSKKTLYQLVDNKAGLIRQIFDSQIDEKKAQIEALREQSENAIVEWVAVVGLMLGQMRQVSPSFRFDLEKYYPELAQEMQAFYKSYFEQFIRENLERGKEEGLYRVNVKTPLIARMFVNTALCTGHKELFLPQESTPEAIVEQLFLYHIHGVSTAKGIQYFKQYLGERISTLIK